MENDNKKSCLESDCFIIDYGDGCKFKASKDGAYITRDNGEHWTNLETWFFTGKWNE